MNHRVKYDPCPLTLPPVHAPTSVCVQWLSFAHPDTSCAQLRVLQEVLKKLLGGMIDVRTNAYLEGIYGIKIITRGAQWEAALANSLLWIDYACIPQPSAADENEDQPAAVEQVQVATEEEEKQEATSKPGISRRSSDHRLITTEAGTSKAKLVEQLVAAVDSIPSYIERCTQMWVLVPPTEHADLPGTTCDFFSWRHRGWCRMEFAASKLARGDDMPIVVIESEASVYYLNPVGHAR